MQPMPPTQPVTAPTRAVSNAAVPNAAVSNAAWSSVQMTSAQPQVPLPMPADPETAAFLRAVRRRQLIWIVIGAAAALAAVIALLIWPNEIKEGVAQGAAALWRLLQMIFGGFGN
ncbi:hypothetical protein [Nakamurella lactea]|jgi:ferric-dicitrate binding protein FerR (iron transport regulator)|uniref:hypothetical protein n=1 Tax=Nakamurella lactea TaxID=459515 RepID=UPI00048AD848|nr:hypothetical protein [Nakamurella lactea]